MTTLIENKIYSHSSPLAQLFASITSQEDGYITKGDLIALVDRFCTHHPLSFVQKKLLLVMLYQGFSRCASQKGKLSWNDLMVYAPKLLLFFGSTSRDTHTFLEQASKRFQDISNNSSTLSFQKLTLQCESNLPRMCPNKKLLSAFLAHHLCVLCSGTMQVTERMWCDTARALLFEVDASL